MLGQRRDDVGQGAGRVGQAVIAGLELDGHGHVGRGFQAGAVSLRRLGAAVAHLRQVSLVEAGRQARALGKPHDAVADCAAQVADHDGPIEEHLDLEVVRAGGRILGHVLVGDGHTIGQLLVADRAAAARVEVIVHGRDAGQAEVLFQRFVVVALAAAEGDVSVGAHVKAGVGHTIERDGGAARQADLGVAVVARALP